MKHPRRLWFRVLRASAAALLGIYVLASLAVWSVQTRVLYHPSRTVYVTPADLGGTFENVTLALKNDRLAGWWVPAKTATAHTLLYLHGNAGNVAPNAEQVMRLHATGLNIFIFDYRGYGNSTGGPPREALLYEDAQRAWRYLVDERKIAPADIVVYGHSLGGAIGIDLASRHPEAGALITESAFTSVIDATTGTPFAYLPLRLIVTERFDSMSKIASVRVPKLIIHGLADSMLSPRMAQRLYDMAREPKQLALIAGGGHEDSADVNAKAYFAAIDSFLGKYLRRER